LHDAGWISPAGWFIFRQSHPKNLMNRLICLAAALTILLAGGFMTAARAQNNLDLIGVTLLRAMTTNLDGSGIRVAQPEAYDGGVNKWEVNPSTVGRSTNIFAYISAVGTSTNYPNSVGFESGHANGVGSIFYGTTGSGVATNVAHVDSFDADYFINAYVVSNLLVLGDPVVNQSFTFGNVTNNIQTNGFYPISVSDQQGIDSVYDDYATANGTLFVSAANNQLSVSPPGTGYNCISVAAYGGGSSIGPTLDNGRCKPDITAPAGTTSFSTPQIAGAAAVLLQAALRGDGGGDTNSACDMKTIKALLLNGAVKPADWTNTSASPLDARYGAGLVNVFNAYKQLAGGQQVFCASNSVASGAAHPPTATTNTIPATSGWDWQNLASDATNDAVNHYFFNVTNGMATATLVWNRQFGATNINDLDLFLINAANSNLVACSTSRVDNVEHLFVPNLPAGRYDLQVLKNGGTNVVSDAETYALAFGLVPTELSLARSGPNAVVAWPVYPAGFRVEAATNLVSPAWVTNNLPPSTITNSRHTLILNATNAAQFFRLRQPNF
jgi:hypothetical protein